MNLRRYQLILSVYPMARGYAFVLFEGPFSPVDWGVSRTYGPLKNERCLRATKKLLRRYEPDWLVLADPTSPGSRRARRIRDLIGRLRGLAESRSVQVASYPREAVRAHFSRYGFATKHAIAQEIAKHIPALGRFVPPVRKPWMSEDMRMGLFDAAALALVFLHSAASTSSREP